MRKKIIYQNNSGHLEIEYDGEYFQITQGMIGLEEWTISVTKYELEEMLKFAKEKS